MHLMLFRVLCLLVLSLLSVSAFAAEPLLLSRAANSRVEPHEATTNQPLAVLTNAAAVRALAPEQAARHWPVRLRGVVVLSEGTDVTIADETGGIFISAEPPLEAPLKMGDVIEVEGVSDPGKFAPCIRGINIAKLGRTNISAPRPVVLDELLTGRWDAQLIQISGVVRRAEVSPMIKGKRIITLVTGGGRLSVSMPKDATKVLPVGSEISVSGVCFYQFNKDRQVLNPILVVPSGVGVITLRQAPADPFTLPLRPISSLREFHPEELSRYGVRIRGVVTYGIAEEGFWIRNENRGLRVQSWHCEQLAMGTEVEVFGFITRGSYSPVLEDALFKKTGVAPPPDPLRLNAPAQALDHDADLVELEAMICELKPVTGGCRFTLESDMEQFSALLRIAGSNSIPREWSPGSLVRVVGICRVDEPLENWAPGTKEPTSFQLLLRRSEDILLLRPPPWWTPQHLAWVLGISTAALLLLLFGAILTARLRHLTQTRARMMAEAEFAAVFNERNRIAREIHDTLAQGLTAISVNLDLAWRRVPEESEAKEPLSDARSLTRASLSNVRNAIWNMRSQVLETGDLATALGGILKTMHGGDHIKSELRVVGLPRRLAPVMENNILRIGQEAITNASRHAQAKHIEVVLAFEERGLRLSITDDGKGFDPSQPPKSKGGFGLIGMRERAVIVRGKLTVSSEVGKGTTITLEVLG